MVSRQETSRPLLTPGEVMQLPAADELVLVSGIPPIRARKLRYFEDRNFNARALAPPPFEAGYAGRPLARGDDWTGRTAPKPVARATGATLSGEGGWGLRQQRQPSVATQRRAKRQAPDQLDLLAFGLDEPDPAVDSRALGSSSAPEPVLAAHAVNDGSTGGGDLLPGF
jgi:type IV secretion system protein VirD4